MIKRYVIGLLSLLCCLTGTMAQGFVNLTSQELSIDSMLPYYTYAKDLGRNYNDSTYSVSIEYPEFVVMTEAEIAKYKSITKDSLPSLPLIKQDVTVSRKIGQLEIAFVPLVFRNGKYMKLTSFKLNITASPRYSLAKSKLVPALVSAKNSRYVSHSVLASGTWAKIRIPESGIYQLTSSFIKKAGFSDPSKVKIYGYGGALLNETFTQDDLIAHDDLKEVPTCSIGGKRLFYGQGPISWGSTIATKRTVNPYSSYGYYFLTESDSVPLTEDSTAFVNSFYPKGDDYHTLYEVDDYAWFPGGRNLFDSKEYSVGSSYSYTLTSPGLTNKGSITVALTSDQNSRASVAFNDSILGTINVSTPGSYDKASEQIVTFNINNIKASNKVTITEKSGGTMRLDFLSLYYNTPKPMSSLTTTSYNTPEFVETISNQDLHADSAAYDMIIIVPKSGKLTTQAERIKTLHETKDSLRVKIVAADKLYNEYSSGTPDATAYRKYMKMLYDKAESDNNMPRYLLLFGDCAWDNRMLTSDWKIYHPDDFLLCFESENSFSETDCYVSEDYFGMLDDGEGSNLTAKDKPDLGVGRFPVRTEEEAKIIVDKTIRYMNYEEAGGWMNTICLMGDDGNENLHMDDANQVAKMVESNYPGYIIKRIMWDAYTRVTSSTGNSYPDATNLIKQQVNNGALMMNYTGHGAAYCISHEQVLKLADFESFTSPRLPLWLTASCDIMPFDGQTDNIGEKCLLNEKGGAIAFFGTTRTVYSFYNRRMNLFFTKYVLGSTNGVRNKLGDAVRMSKNSLILTGQDYTANKLQYALLGDPALTLACPTMNTVIDSINGVVPSSNNTPTLKAGTVVKVKGHVEANGTKQTTFNGSINATVRDSEEKILCKNNADSDTAFWFIDRPKTIYNGGDSVKNGEFSFTFAVPMDINYSNLRGEMNVFAINNDKTLRANGSFEDFLIGGTNVTGNDSIGPSIYCYLNSSSFVDGCTVNPTPYFFAQVNDDNGINATGNGIGHDLELIIDGKTEKAYVLNDYYTNDFGSYTSGTIGYSIPELTEGKHSMLFRAWDILNNSSTAQFTFNVAKSLEPNCFSVGCTKNPATTSTTFIITHDRTESELNVDLEVFDTSGRLLWRHSEVGTPTDNTYTIDWDLTTNTGFKLQTGIYLYRAQISSDGSSKASKAKKLIIIGNK